MKNIRNIIFDYDGTLHDSIKIYAPSFRKAYDYLVRKGMAEDRIWEDNEISIWLGYSAKDMWRKFMPNLNESEKKYCSELIGKSMLNYIDGGHAELYDGAEEVLRKLKEKGFNLIFLSNCKLNYMELHKTTFKLNRYFLDFYCTEEFNFLPKNEIFNQIREKYVGDFVVIGDRLVDIEIATNHNLYSIGCNYGYGNSEELRNANYIIDDIRDVLKILNS